MKEEEAVNVLIQAAHLGQIKGAYTLNDAALIKQAIDILSKTFNLEEQNIQEEVETNSQEEKISPNCLLILKKYYEEKYVFNKEELPEIKLALLGNDAGIIGATLI